MSDLRDKFRGALLGLAVGDALGAPFEGAGFTPRDAFDGWTERVPHTLSYTDDAAMALGMARSLIECGGFDGDHLARTFAADYRAEPWRGYGPGPPQLFARIEQGEPWDRVGRLLFGGEGSFGNGGAMRVAPAALLAYPDLDRTAELARDTARITHAHEQGIDGTVLQACAVGWLLQADPAQALDVQGLPGALRGRLHTPEFQSALDRTARLDRSAPAREVAGELGHGIEAVRSVPTALHALLRHPDSFPEVLLFVLSLGGDADTIGAMAGALSGAFHGESAIPEPWRQHVEDADVARQLADRLLELARPQG